MGSLKSSLATCQGKPGLRETLSQNNNKSCWGCNSVGGMPAYHAGNPGSDSPTLHKTRCCGTSPQCQHLGGTGRRTRVQGYPQLHFEFETSLSCKMLCLSERKNSRAWWHLPIIPTLRKPRQVDLWEFKIRLVYIWSSRIAGTTQ